MRLTSEQELLWNLLSKTVQQLCHGRDPSHGHQHMELVAKSSLEILDKLPQKNDPNIRRLVIITAWLHDVADHKYDVDGKLREKIQIFISSIVPSVEESQLVVNIIDRISFTKEDKCIKTNQPLDWKNVLGITGCIVRDIVSDADKLEAIGLVGAHRCVEYQCEYFMKKNIEKPTVEYIIGKVIEHANEKLFKLSTEFIRTDIGKVLAKEKHNELVAILSPPYVKLMEIINDEISKIK